MLARDAPGRLTMLECRFNKTTHHPKRMVCRSMTTAALALVCVQRDMLARMICAAYLDAWHDPVFLR